MDARRNPFSPGAGTRPPELAGRDDLLERAAVALDRIRAGRAARSVVLYGLRGVGKTVLLTTIRNRAEAEGIVVVALEAPENRSLPGILVPSLRASLLKLDRLKGAGDKAKRALRALAGFAKLKGKYGDLEVSVDFEPEEGLADSGDLNADLADLIVAIGEAARERGTAVVLLIDELQYVPEEQLASLIAALHRASQLELPITMLGAGLPQLLGQMGRAKSYAERLFEFVSVGPLDARAAGNAIKVPIEREGESIEATAVAAIVQGSRSRRPRHPLTCAPRHRADRTEFVARSSTAGSITSALSVHDVANRARRWIPHGCGRKGKAPCRRRACDGTLWTHLKAVMDL